MMGQATPTGLNTALTLLSIGSILVPILCGFGIFKLTQIFITKGQFEDYQKLVQAELRAMKDRIEMIERDARNRDSRNRRGSE